MKERQEMGWQSELEKKREHAAKGRKRVVDAKKLKAARTSHRLELMRQASAAASTTAKVERASQTSRVSFAASQRL